MNDLELDELLSAQGRRFQREHDARPHVDWDSVIASGRGPRRRWVPAAALAAAAAVAVAVAVPVALLRGDGAPTPPAHPSPPARHAVLGGPAYFLAVRNGEVSQVDARTGESTGTAARPSAPTGPITALAGTGDGRIAYGGSTKPGCSVVVDRYFWKTTTRMDMTQAAEITGARADAIAVSRDGHKLAVSVRTCSQPSGSEAAVDDLVVVDLRTHTQRRWHGNDRDVSLVGALSWGPDNRTVTYTVTPCCGGGHDGPRFLDTSAAGSSYVAPSPVASGGSGNAGPAFWLSELPVVLTGTTVRLLADKGSLGPALIWHIPADVQSIDVDSTARHLLITTPSGIFRWDAGVLRRIPGRWTDAGW